MVTVGSVAQAPLGFADLRMDNHFTGSQAYYRSKFALAAFTLDFAEKLTGGGITAPRSGWLTAGRAPNARSTSGRLHDRLGRRPARVGDAQDLRARDVGLTLL